MRTMFVLLCAALLALAMASSTPSPMAHARRANASIAASAVGVDGREPGALVPRTPQTRIVVSAMPSPTPRARTLRRDSLKRGRAGMHMHGTATGLRLIAVDKGVKFGAYLQNGARFCPRGRSVVCLTKGAVSHVHFSIDQHIVRTEISAPYVIAGDRNGTIFPWLPSYYGKIKLGCETQDHVPVKVNVVLSCPSKSHAAPLAKLPVENAVLEQSRVVKPAGSSVSHNMPVKKSAFKKPAQKKALRNKKQAPPKPTRKKPSTNKAAPKKLAPKKSTSGKGVSSKPVAKRQAPKRHATRKHATKKQAPKEQALKKLPPKKLPPKKLSLVTKSGPRFAPIGFSKQRCVWVLAKSFRHASHGATGRDAWVHVHDGVAYKTSFRGHRTFRPKHRLEYSFTVPITAHYAIVLDMTTRHYTEHNDVWVSLAGVGIRLRRKHKVHTRSGFIKAYHNENKRALASFSVDHNAHSMSSARPLKAGKTYKIVIAGRSSKLVLHRILFFPCEGKECHNESGVWKSSISKC